MANKNGIIEFKDYLTSKGSKHIKAADLDNNFRRLTPINPDGRSMFTVTDGGISFNTIDIDVCVDGVAKKITVIGIGPY